MYVLPGVGPSPYLYLIGLGFPLLFETLYPPNRFCFFLTEHFLYLRIDHRNQLSALLELETKIFSLMRRRRGELD